MRYNLQNETIESLHQIPPGCVSKQSSQLGANEGEPLLVCMDALLRYAKAYESRFECKLQTDQVLGDHWLEAIKGIRGLLNGDGAVALERGISTDSKDNGALESVFWSAMTAAGFQESDC